MLSINSTSVQIKFSVTRNITLIAVTLDVLQSNETPEVSRFWKDLLSVYLEQYGSLCHTVRVAFVFYFLFFFEFFLITFWFGHGSGTGFDNFYRG